MPQLEDWLTEAKSEADTMMSQIAIGPYYMNEFGINDIKKFEVSPDAFCQAALQVMGIHSLMAAINPHLLAIRFRPYVC